MSGFVQTSHCSWRNENGHRIIKLFKPCKGGIVFALFDGQKVTNWKTLQDAITESERTYGKPDIETNNS